jgi:hypothetical protein
MRSRHRVVRVCRNGWTNATALYGFGPYLRFSPPAWDVTGFEGKSPLPEIANHHGAPGRVRTGYTGTDTPYHIGMSLVAATVRLDQ